MFLESKQFPFTSALESRWRVIRQEFEQLTAEQLMPWPEKAIYNHGWEAFGLWAFGHRFDQNCRACPQTAAVVATIPGLTMAGFSRMAPSTRIHPHVGYTNSVLRCHLGLVVPAGCGIQVGDQVCRWEEGKCLVFDDTTLHSAWNDSDQPRIILIADFVRPGMRFDPAMSPEAAEAMAVLLKDEPRM